MGANAPRFSQGHSSANLTNPGDREHMPARRHRTLRLDDVARLTASIAKVRPFITTLDWTPGALTDADDLKARVTTRTPEQLNLF